MFGDSNGNWQKNDLWESIKSYFENGGSMEGFFDVLRAVYEYEVVPSANLEHEIQQLKADNYRLEHNEKVLLQREERAINYIDQVIMYKPCAKEIDEELNTLIGMLRGEK